MVITNLLTKLEPIRRWFDGEDAARASEELFKERRPRRASEEFLVLAARAAGAVMERESFTPPGGPTYIPGEFVVFLSPEDDKDWRGVKRRGLEDGLARALGQRAKDLFRNGPVNRSQFAVELRVDGTLTKGQFSVKAVWDSDAPRTVVAARRCAEVRPRENVTRAEGEVTVVKYRPRAVLYSLAIMRDGEPQYVVPVTKDEIMIGRGSSAIEVDLPLKGDGEISRLHAVLARDAHGNIWLTPTGLEESHS